MRPSTHAIVDFDNNSIPGSKTKREKAIDKHKNENRNLKNTRILYTCISHFGGFDTSTISASKARGEKTT